MQLKFSLFLTVVALFFSGCKTILSITGDYKKPKYEDAESLKIFLAGAKYSSLYVGNTAQGYKFLVDSVFHDRGTVNIYIFNKNRKNLCDSSSCAWASVKILDSLDNIPARLASIDFDKLLLPLKTVDGIALNQANWTNYDYFIFYTWTKMLPKLSTKMIGKVNQFALKTDKKVFIGPINLDLQASWQNKF